MAQELWVVYCPSTGLYLTNFNLSNPPASLFGNLKGAINFPDQATADGIAAQIGHGTGGVRRP